MEARGALPGAADWQAVKSMGSMRMRIRRVDETVRKGWGTDKCEKWQGLSGKRHI